MNKENIIGLTNNIQVDMDVKDYITNNKYPNYLKKTSFTEYITMKNKHPILDDYEYHNYNYSSTYDKINVKEIMNKCNNLIKCMTENEPEIEKCPICLTEFEETNYVIPKCKHKVCAICFTNNIKYNKHTGDCCVICRQQIC